MIVDTRSSLTTFAGLAVVGAYDRIECGFHAVVVTELKTAQETYLRPSNGSALSACWCPRCFGPQDRKTEGAPRDY